MYSQRSDIEFSLILFNDDHKFINGMPTFQSQYIENANHSLIANYLLSKAKSFTTTA